MNKALKYAANGALIVGLGNAILNTNKQINKEENKNFNWNEFFIAFCKGALLGGVSGLTLGAIKDNEMTKTLIAVGGTTGFIKEALNNYSDDNPILISKSQKVQKKLYKEFGEYLSEFPSINGSIIKGTAIQNSDIDIQLKFNKSADSIENIRNNVEDYLKNIFYDRNLIRVRNQNHSVGLFFDLGGEEKRIDVVPMREIENGKGDTYLYSVNNNSIRKTNAQKQIRKLKFTEKQKQIIKLLKGWKMDNDLKFPSILIENLVKRAFAEINIPHKIDKAVLAVIEFIAIRITNIRVIDQANSNNIISDSLTKCDKLKIQKFCNKMIAEIKKDERNIQDYFWINTNYF